MNFMKDNGSILSSPTKKAIIFSILLGIMCDIVSSHSDQPLVSGMIFIPKKLQSLVRMEFPVWIIMAMNRGWEI